jgi:hypothetical protein
MLGEIHAHLPGEPMTEGKKFNLMKEIDFGFITIFSTFLNDCEYAGRTNDQDVAAIAIGIYDKLVAKFIRNVELLDDLANDPQITGVRDTQIAIRDGLVNLKLNQDNLVQRYQEMNNSGEWGEDV